MATDFGKFLKGIRMSRGYGLKQFADMIGELPSNLSAIEHGRRGAPASPEKLRQIADALALVDGSVEWERFFFLARQPGQLPAHVQHYAELEIFPVLCRTLNQMRPTEDELKILVEMLKKHRRKARKHGDD
ncbi:MAG TPA: helix-turn-helix transcriptional regulator [Pirellulaceae bacterium]|jgi:transcriptional regulator with XRE-family HTH domain